MGFIVLPQPKVTFLALHSDVHTPPPLSSLAIEHGTC